MSITKLADGRYQWRHRVGGKHLKKTFATRRDATAHDSKVRADVARGTHVDLTDKTTVSQYFRAWYESRVLRTRTLRSYTGILRNHIEPLPLGSRPVVKVRPSEIQVWVRDRADVLAPGTLRIYVGLLRSMFATAQLDGVIARNPVQPARHLSLPKADKPELVPLTIAQVQAWADAAEPRAQAMILAQAGLGPRISELLALRVADIDFLRREVHIDEQLDLRGRRAPLKTTTRRSRRKVPLPSVISEALAEHIRLFPPGPHGLVFTTEPGRKNRRDGRPNSGGLTRRPDGSWTQQRAGTAYREAAERAGITLPPNQCTHALRHHYVSVLLDAGESVHAVAERIGDTPEMVLKVYGHLMPDREDTTRRAVDAAWKAAGKAARERKSVVDERG